MKPATSIRRQVARSLFGVTALAMVAVATALWVFEYRAADLRARATLESLAETMAPGLLASLDFDTPAVASENLQRLESGGIVIAATVFRTFADSTPPQLFATYLRPGRHATFPPRPEATGFTRRRERALFNHILRAEGHPIALLQLEADVGPFRRSLHESLFILGLVLLLVGSASLWLTRLLQRALTRPLLQLAATVERVRASNDYSVRTGIAQRDEIGRLAEGFDLMLSGIEERDRRLAEQAAFQHAVLENAGVSIVSASPNGVIRSFNAASEHLLGYRREEVVGIQSFTILFDPVEVAQRVAALAQHLGHAVPPGLPAFAALARQEPAGREWSYLRKDGTRLPVFLVLSELRTPDGRDLGLCGIATDLTERKVAEERYRTVIDTTSDGFWIIDGAGRILTANNAICNILGYSRDELLGLSIPDLENSEDAAAVVAHLAAIARTGVDRFETRLHRKDDGPLDTEVSINHLPGPETRFFVFIRDISERKRAETALRASEEQLRLTIAHSGEIYLQFELASRRIRWAGMIEAISGFTSDFLNAQPVDWWATRIHPEDRSAFDHLFARLGTAGGQGQMIYRFHRRDDTWIYLLSSATALAGPDGRPGRLFCSLADITRQQESAEEIRRLNADLEQRVRDRTAELDRRIGEVEHLNADLRTSQDDLAHAAARLQEANANLLAANQELESFSYSVSHDLRAPLRNIAGFIELLRKRTTGQLDAEADRYFGIVGSEAVRMGSLIDDLLTFSRIGRAELHFAPVQLAALVAEVQAELQSDLTGRQIDWRLQPMPPALGDRTLLRQVVANLLSNAVKFTRRCPLATIEIGAQPGPPDSELLTFFVRDNGAGFDPKYSAKLFGVFQRLHNPRDFEGTGIGLANVKRIVNRHGGHVWADGTPGQGATFYFTLRPAPV